MAWCDKCWRILCLLRARHAHKSVLQGEGLFQEIEDSLALHTFRRACLLRLHPTYHCNV